MVAWCQLRGHREHGPLSPAGTILASADDAFYNGFAAQYNKHFCIDETGSGSDAVSSKEAGSAAC